MEMNINIFKIQRRQEYILSFKNPLHRNIDVHILHVNCNNIPISKGQFCDLKHI